MKRTPFAPSIEISSKRGIDGGAGGLDGAVFARGDADTHEGGAGILHDGADISEVDVHDTRPGDEVGNPLHALSQDIVDDAKGGDERRLPVDDREKLVVRDGDERIDAVLQIIQRFIGDGTALGAFEGERSRDDTDGEGAELFGGLRDDGGRAGTGPAAEATGDEHHVGAFQDFLDLIAVLFRGLTADLGIHPGAESLGQILADVNFLLSARVMQRLRIGVDSDEFDTLDLGIDHPRNRIATRTADADDFDFGERFDVGFDLGHTGYCVINR